MFNKTKNFISRNWKPALSGTGVGLAIGLPVGVYFAQDKIGELILATGGFLTSIIKLAGALVW